MPFVGIEQDKINAAKTEALALLNQGYIAVHHYSLDGKGWVPDSYPHPAFGCVLVTGRVNGAVVSTGRMYDRKRGIGIGPVVSAMTAVGVWEVIR